MMPLGHPTVNNFTPRHQSFELRVMGGQIPMGVLAKTLLPPEDDGTGVPHSDYYVSAIQKSETECLVRMERAAPTNDRARSERLTNLRQDMGEAYGPILASTSCMYSMRFPARDHERDPETGITYWVRLAANVLIGGILNLVQAVARCLMYARAYLAQPPEDHLPAMQPRVNLRA